MNTDESKLRSECVERANDVVKLGSKILPKGWQLVVIVTNPQDVYIGISTNGGTLPTEVILDTAVRTWPRQIQKESEP